MDDVLKRMEDWPWHYADKDPTTVAILENKIARAAVHEDPRIAYSDLVRGVKFNLPDGPYEIREFQNYGFDSRLIGEYLGYICKRSYEEAGFMASAVVVMKEEGDLSMPSPNFFEWMTNLGCLESSEGDKAIEFWLGQIQKAQAYYRSRA